jgi:hypothetical protein
LYAHRRARPIGISLMGSPAGHLYSATVRARSMLV